MATPILGRGGRVAVAGLLLALSGSLIPVANVLAAGVIPATGGEAIPAADAGTSNFTTLTGPVIIEAGAGELATGTTTILNAPQAFRFKPGVGAAVSDNDCDLIGSLTVTSTQAIFTAVHSSTQFPCALRFLGLQVQPNSSSGLVTASITKTGTSAAPSNVFYGRLEMVAGPFAKLAYVTQPSASNLAGVAFGTQPKVLALDQFSNPVNNVSVTLSITPGTGPSGAVLTCTTNPVIAGGILGGGWAGCTIDQPGQYKLRASSGAISVDSDSITVGVGTPSKLVFKGYPGASTPAALTPQPQVAVTDDNGNTVTSQPATPITLAINKSGGTFACTGGLTATTVNGVATFTGCTQTTPDSGYALTASASFANTTGATFTVTAAPGGGPSAISLTTFCGSPTPISTSGPNRCALDTSKSPDQANIRLPQTASEGVRLRAHIASNGANRSLTFEVSANQTTWSTIGSATTDAAGDASVFYRPSDNRYYRVTFAGAPDLGAATSPQVRVVVRALVFLRPAGCTASVPCRISLDDEITFTATARPNRAELPQQAAVFTVQRKSGSTWVDADIDALVIPVSKATGTALFNVGFNVQGTWRLRVNLAPTSVNANSFPTDYLYYSVS